MDSQICKIMKKSVTRLASITFNYGSFGTNREYVVEPKPSKSVNPANLLSTLFAPHPVTGLPMNSIQLVFRSDVDDQVKQFVKDSVLGVLPPRAGAPDDATAFATMQLRSDDITSYGDRLRTYVDSLSEENPEDAK